MRYLIFFLLSTLLAGPVSGQVTFTRIEVATAAANPYGKGAGDLNADGKPDLFVCSNSAGPIRWYEDSLDTWVPHTIPNTVGQRYSTDIRAGDIDGDGDNDLMVIDLYTSARVEWYENPLYAPSDSGVVVGNPDTGTWTEHGLPVIRGVPHDIWFIDISGDGKLDVVGRPQGGNGQYVHLWIQGATPNAWSMRELSGFGTGEGIWVQDLDGDNRPDIILPGRWLKTPSNPLTGTFTSYTYTTAWTYATAKIAVGLIDTDANLDIAIAPAEPGSPNYKVAWYKNPGNPTQSGWAETVLEASVQSLRHSLGIADFDMDGDGDIVSAEMSQSVDPDEVMVYWQGPGNTWTKDIIYTLSSHNIIVFDEDADGDMDFFGCNWSGAVPINLWVNPTAEPICP